MSTDFDYFCIREMEQNYNNSLCLLGPIFVSISTMRNELLKFFFTKEHFRDIAELIR